MKLNSISSLIILLFIVSLIGSSFFFFKYKKTQNELSKIKTNPQKYAQEEADELVKKISKHFELPSDEEPTIATVSDLEKLANQPFFAKAKEGDKVLIYNKAKTVILYDPNDDKIIAVGPLLDDSGEKATTSVPETKEVNPTKSEKLRAVLYNGTQKVGFTRTVEPVLKEKAPYIEVVDKDFASKRDYLKTLVIDLTGNYKNEAENLAEILSGEVSELPDEETKPSSADILIIVGEDKK